MRLSKSDLINRVSKASGFTKKDTGIAVNATIDEIVNILADGYELNIIGFGKFVVVDTVERTGTHPVTGEKFVVPPSRLVKFRPSKELKGLVR